MLIEKLSLTFKCHSAIGNSLDLPKMIQEVLRVFVSETFAVYGAFAQVNKAGLYEVKNSFGRIDIFDINDYKDYDKGVSFIEKDNVMIIVIQLNNGLLSLVFKNRVIDFPFYISMFESLLTKLNMSIDSCLNVEHIKQKNLLLEKQKEELIEANKSKDDFLANMSHELKTPLNSINVISSVMMKNKKGKLDSEQVKNLQIINGCGNDLLYLINDVLDLSKLEAGEIELNYENIDFEQTMNSIKEMFLPQIKEKSLILEYAFDERVKNIYSDAQRIKQIVKNLLSNALKFTQKGVIRLRVKKSEESVQIIVQDEGIGISKEKIEHIFDRFKQADGSTTRQYGGTGLGLAICKELVSLLKGEISVKSKEGEGTTFTINIPMNLDKVVDKVEEFYALPKGKEMIFFNSDPVFFFSFIMVLKKEYEVIQTDKYEEFLMHIKTKNDAYIIMDVSDEINYELCLEILPVIKQQLILISNKEITDLLLKEKSLLIFDKPLDLEIIMEKIRLLKDEL